MLGADNIWTWLIAHVRVLLPEDWTGSAGELFREGTQAISQAATTYRLMPEDLLNEGRRKITGLATKEHAEAEKNYAEARKAFTEGEDRKIDTELKQRALQSDIRRREADARLASAEADLKEIQVLDARFELIRKLNSAGMQLHRDDMGDLTIFPRSQDLRTSLSLNPDSKDDIVG